MNDTNRTFSEYALKYAGALRRFAISLCRNEFDADDLVSETIVKAYENFGKLKDKTKVRQWVFRILSNLFFTVCRERKKIISNTISWSDENEDSFSLFDVLENSTFAAEGNPEKDFINMLTKEKIEKAMLSLPEDFRIVIELCDVEEFSYTEISVILSIPSGTVRSRISRARAMLQKKLWQQAQELGIRTIKKKKKKDGHVCTCGNEKDEIKESESLTVQL